jgi:hypothetical protein
VISSLEFVAQTGTQSAGGRLIQLLNNFDRKIECFPEMFLARSSSESNGDDARQSNAGAFPSSTRRLSPKTRYGKSNAKSPELYSAFLK